MEKEEKEPINFKEFMNTEIKIKVWHIITLGIFFIVFGSVIG